MPFPDGIADFRSDTVTRPTPEMIQAMASAPLGDDVYSDDPTVNLLEEESAAVTGKEAAIYVPTGTMGNQLSIMAQTNPGEEVLAHEGSHVRSIEAGAPQALSGVGFRTVSGDGGRIEPEDVERAMAMSGFFPRIGLMVWENTHNLSGGRVIPLDVMEKTSEVARTHGLKIHVDGARIFNAVAASGVTRRSVCRGVGHHPVLLLQGAGGAGRVDRLWPGRSDRRDPVSPQATRRRDAAGRRDRRRGAGGPGRA